MNGIFIVFRTTKDQHDDYNPDDIDYEDEYLIRNYNDAKIQHEEWIKDERTYTAGYAKLVESTDHDPEGEI